jgi:hypothetical protein
MGREWHAAYERANEALQWGNPQITDRLSLLMVGLSLTLDALLAFTREDDARRVMAVLPKRFAKFGLSLHPDKTRMVPFRRPPHNAVGKGDPGQRPGCFDVLGFTHFWGRSRKGHWVVKRKTASNRMSRAIRKISY